jgi:hypothetical protein
MILSFGVKSLYYLLGDRLDFVLERYPRADDLPLYIAIASLLALLFTLSVWFFYDRVRSRLPARPTTASEELHPFSEHVLLLVALALLAWFLWDKSAEIMEKARTNAILYRSMSPRGEDYESGALGVGAFLSQVRNGLFIAILSHAVLARRYVLATIAMAYFAGAVVVSDGSRFTVIGGVAILPLMLYFCWWRKDHQWRGARTTIYLTILLLPFVAAPLQLLRTEGALPQYSELTRHLASAALSTFDGLDHLVNYIYLLPIDWTGSRATEELWQFLPRALYPDKPHLYGLLALQEVMYPHVVGGGGRYLLYGHYPLSNVVMALDACGPVGLLLHAAGTGGMLAWLDWLALRRTTLSVACIVGYLTTSYHLVRVGFQNYVFSGVAAFAIPFMLFWFFLYLARVRRTTGTLLPPSPAESDA